MSFDTATTISLRNLGREPDLKLTFSLAQPTDALQGNLAFFNTDALDEKVKSLSELEDTYPSNIVREIGDTLYERLSENDQLPVVMSYALQANMQEPRPIHIVFPDVDRELAETIPWEMMRHPDKDYLGLLETSPVTRIVRSTAPFATDEDILNGPVRIAAVLGAEGMDPRQELDALRDACLGWPADPPWNLHVFVPSTELVDLVNNDDTPLTSAELTPDRASVLIRKLNAFRPHFLHILGHGFNRGGGEIQISTPACEFGGEPLYMKPMDLARAASGVWLVTLNVCLSAAPDDTDASFASGLLSQGVRGVVAMREPVRYDTASEFCAALYSEIGLALQEKLQSSSTTELYWGTAVTRARNALCNGSRDCKAWTLPVLYLQPQPIRLTVRAQADPDIDQNLVQQTLAKIAELERLEREFQDMDKTDVAAAISVKIEELRQTLSAG